MAVYTWLAASCKCRLGGHGINVTYEDPMDTAAAGDAAGADGTAGGSAPATRRRSRVFSL